MDMIYKKPKIQKIYKKPQTKIEKKEIQQKPIKLYKSSFTERVSSINNVSRNTHTKLDSGIEYEQYEKHRRKIADDIVAMKEYEILSNINGKEYIRTNDLINPTIEQYEASFNEKTGKLEMGNKIEFHPIMVRKDKSIFNKKNLEDVKKNNKGI